MKQFVLLTLVFLQTFSSAFGQQVACQTVVSSDSSQSSIEVQTVKRKMTPEEAKKLTQEFMDKKLLFSTIQFVAIMASEPDYSRRDYRTMLRGGDMHERAEWQFLAPKLKKLAAADKAFNDVDKKYIDDWKSTSVQVLDYLIAILDEDEDTRNQHLDLIRGHLVQPGSRQELVNILLEIRKMQDEEPEKYNAFIEAWKATMPLAAKEIPKRNRYGYLTKEIIFHLSTAAIGATAAITYFSGSGGLQFASGAFATFYAIGGITPAMILSPVQYVKNTLRNMTPGFIKKFTRERVKNAAHSVLGLTEVEAKELLDVNNEKERDELDRLQDKSLPELLTLMKEADKVEIKSSEQAPTYQKLQMQIMVALSDKFSILSERKDKIDEKVVEFIKTSNQIAKMSEKDRRNKLGDISALYKDSLEFGLDVNTLIKNLTQASDSMTNQIEALKVVLAKQDPKQAETMIEQFVARAAVIDGMKASLEGLKEKVRNDSDTLTHLSTGIMAGQVIDVQSFLRNVYQRHGAQINP